MDQASGLRRLFTQRGSQIVAFTSAGPKLPRSRLLLEAGLALAAARRRVLLIDENPVPKNLALRTIDFAEPPTDDLLQVLRADKPLQGMLCRIGETSLHWVSAHRLAQTDMPRTARLSGMMQEISAAYDDVLIDCASTRATCLSALARHADHLVVMTEGESHGITQSYAQIKRMAQSHDCNDFQVLVVSEGSRNAARMIYNSLRQVAQEHLGLRLAYLGMTPPTQGAPLAALLDILPPPVANTPQSLPFSTLQGA